MEYGDGVLQVDCLRSVAGAMLSHSIHTQVVEKQSSHTQNASVGTFTVNHGSLKGLCVPIVVVGRPRVVRWDDIAIDGCKSHRRSDHRQLFENRLANRRFSITCPCDPIGSVSEGATCPPILNARAPVLR